MDKPQSCMKLIFGYLGFAYWHDLLYLKMKFQHSVMKNTENVCT